MAQEIEILLYRKGQSIPFSVWRASLKDVRGGKRTQGRDILTAKKYWKEYLDAKADR